MAALAAAGAGAKLRCGGVTADTFPAPEQVARFIVAARDAGVPAKFTAGLHHPVRHFSDDVRTEMHGFLNLYVGGMLAHTTGLNWQELAGIIAAVGLCQNLGALRALASEGIQRGHMGLHARNLAVAAGAEEGEIEAVAERLKREGKVRADLAAQFLEELRAG